MDSTTQNGPNVRRLAVDLLRRVDNGANTDKLLAEPHGLSDPDTRLLREIVLGTLTWRLSLDHHLGVYLSRPLARQKPALRTLLRSAAYQILHLDRVPSYAVVSETVDLARKHGKGIAAMTNAVLRGIAEGRKPVSIPDIETDPITHLSLSCSHPTWILDRWVARFGVEKTKQICEANNARPPITIRLNESRTTIRGLTDALAEEGIRLTPIPGLATHGQVDAPLGLFTTQAYQKGWFSVQGPGAGRASTLLTAQPGETVLDVCAAPGGKSIAAAQSPGVRVFASDMSHHRLGRLTQNCERLGLSISSIVADARVLPLRHLFDHVWVDAPCTGLGTLARHPEIRWRRHAEDTARMSELQLEILRGASEAVKPGGCLLYTTCTTEPEENEQVVESFLQNDARFFVDDLDRRESEVNVLPDSPGVDGAYGIRLKKLP